MAGHSKWANIKHRKGRADAKKGKIFSRIAKEIISAVKVGGPDPKGNPRLRLAMDKARAANVPNEIVDRNIKKASNTDQADYVEVTYEIYGHGGVGIFIDAMTDNKNRLASEIRIAINKRGGTLANPGSVAFNFDRKGVLQFSKEVGSEEDLFLAASEAGAEDFEPEEDGYLVITDPSDLYQVKSVLEEGGYKADEANLQMIPKVMADCDEEAQKSNQRLLEWLEGIEDIDEIYHTMSE